MKQLIAFFLVMLLMTVGCTTEGERIRMRSGLDSLNTLNRTDQPFTVQDVEPYVRFFEDHGTSNDRLLAHYLLGRAYYDHSEAPMALQCYHDAIDCADTTAQDCDYAQLARVYGQMAQLFYQQTLYRQQLACDQFSVKYARKAKDTLLVLRNYEQQAFTYLKLKDTMTAITIVEDVAKNYTNYGYPSDAAISLGVLIRPLIDKGQYIKAKKYMDSYESFSGRFDSNGNIEAGREIYYKSKGLYYLCINKLDSAEFFFRKEMSDGKDFSNQHSGALGLAALYEIRHQSDSVAKYYQLAYDMSDSIHYLKKIKEVERLQALYDYSRHQETARQESEKAALANRMLLLCFIVLLAVLLLSSWLYIARKKLIENLQETTAELDIIRKDNYVLKCDTSTNQLQIVANEQRIKQLEKKLGRYSKLVYFGTEKIENDLKVSLDYQRIREMAYKGKKLSHDDWHTIRNLTNEYFPGFFDFILSQFAVDSTEYRICILLRLHFKVGEVGNMLGVSSPYISKVSTAILRIVFEKRGSSKDLYKELCKIC